MKSFLYKLCLYFYIFIKCFYILGQINIRANVINKQWCCDCFAGKCDLEISISIWILFVKMTEDRYLTNFDN
jgi:hypothetical protein